MYHPDKEGLPHIPAPDGCEQSAPCQVCGRVMSPQGHIYINGVCERNPNHLCDHAASTAKPTCAQGAHCTVCRKWLPADTTNGHIWSDEWSRSRNYQHWHECTVAGCPIGRDYLKKDWGQCKGDERMCTEDWACLTCGGEYAAMGHVWNLNTGVCNRFSSHICDHAGSTFPHCVGSGECSICGKLVMVVPNAHTWGEGFLRWEGANTYDPTCTAVRVCIHDESHIETENVSYSKSRKKAPTYTENGAGVLTV